MGEQTLERAKKHLDPCNDHECKLCVPYDGIDGVCCFGLRNTIGCKMEGGDAVDARMDELMAVSTITAGCESIEEYEAAKKIVETVRNRVFTFVYSGHEYTANDSARAQDTCPHCGNRCNGGSFEKTGTDAIYLGSIWFGDHGALCFECADCFKKFFYHTEVEE